ncbi:MAG: hypothetical protein ACREJQ_07095 [bacterium]
MLESFRAFAAGRVVCITEAPAICSIASEISALIAERDVAGHLLALGDAFQPLFPPLLRRSAQGLFLIGFGRNGRDFEWTHLAVHGHISKMRGARMFENAFARVFGFDLHADLH